MSRVRFSEESYAYYKDQIRDLFNQHWDEIGEAGGHQVLEPDDAQYEALGRMGMHTGIVAWDKGEIIGYVSIFMNNHYHHLGVKYATIDTYYIKPEYRKTNPWLGVNLLKYAQDVVQYKYKCKYIRLYENVKYDLGPLTRRLGYVPTDKVSTLELI